MVSLPRLASYSFSSTAGCFLTVTLLQHMYPLWSDLPMGCNPFGRVYAPVWVCHGLQSPQGWVTHRLQSLGVSPPQHGLPTGRSPFRGTCTYHRIIGWKRPLRSSSPTIHPTPPCLLNHIPKCHIYTLFEHLQGWDSTTSLGSLFQCLTTFLVKKFF